MDLTDTIIPKSDQLNSDDLISGPRTVTITEVRRGTDEQPVNIHLAEFPGRPFRPSKTVLRILIAAWDKESDAYVGRRLTLYRDPEVRFGGQDVGGIRVSHMSHISKPMKLALTVSKGRKAAHVVKPLAGAPTAAIRPVDPPDGPLTDDQLKRLNALLRESGITDRETALATVAQIVGREVASTKDLTKQEAAQAISAIERTPAVSTGQVDDSEPTLPGAES